MATTPLDVQDAALARIRALLMRDVDRIWNGLFDPADPAGSLARIGPLVAARTAEAQSGGLAAAVRYADAVLAAAFGSGMLPAAVPAAVLVGADRYGRDIAAMLAGAGDTWQRRVSTGVPAQDAVRAERAFQSGLAGSAVHDTNRAALTGMADPRSGWSHPQVEGWSRVAHDGACDFCAMLAGRGYAYTSEKTARAAKDGSRYHSRCRCSVAIGPAGTRDPAAEAAYRDWVAAGSPAPGGRRRAGAAGQDGPRLSPADQARLNTANREANRLMAEATRLEKQGRRAEAAALREQAAVHRAEADRTTAQLRGDAAAPRRGGPAAPSADDGSGRVPGDAGRPGAGGSDELLRPLDDEYDVEIVTHPAGLGRGVPAPVDRQTKDQLESEDRIGVGREHLVTPEEHEAADWLEGGGLQLRSVDHTSPGHRHKYPDFAFSNADATLELKTTSGSLPTIRKRLWEGSRQSSRIVLDVTGSPVGGREQMLALMREALGDYGADLDEVVVRGEGYVLRWWAGRAG